MGEGGNENRIRPSISALSVNCLRTGVRKKKCFISCDVWVTILLIHLPLCPDLENGQMKDREHTDGLSIQRCFSQYIFPPVMGSLRASWVGKFVFKSLKGLPSLEFVSFPFYQCCLQWKANSDWVLEKWSYGQEVPGIWSGISRWMCTLPAWENGILKHIYLSGPPGSGTAESPPAAVQINWGQQCL